MSTEPALLVVLGGSGLAVGSWMRARLRRSPAQAASVAVGSRAFELGNAALWSAAGLRFGPHLVIIPYLVLFSVLLALSVIDLEQYILPNRITYPAIVFALVAIPIVSIVIGRSDAIVGALAGGAGYFLFLFIPAAVYPKGMGFGDVKLAGLMGLYLGWIHPFLPFPALIIASLVGLLAGLVLLIRRGTSRPYPFGPWLALGCVLAILFSGPLLASYGY